MHIQFERQEYRFPVGEHVELRATVMNNDHRLDGLTYDVETASDPAMEVRWSVNGPSSLEPGQRASIVVTLLPESASHNAALTVRLTVAGAHGRQTTAETIVVFGDERCAAFAAAPSLTLSPDGSVTASVMLVNCGLFKISLRLSARCDDGSTLTIDRPEVTLAAGDDPISVTFTMRRPDGRHVGEDEHVRVELISDDAVLAWTQAGVRAALRPPSRHGVGRAIGTVAGAVLLLALAVPVLANLLEDGSGDGGTVRDEGVGGSDPGTNGGDEDEPDPDDEDVQPPSVEITSPSDGARAEVGESVTLGASTVLLPCDSLDWHSTVADDPLPVSGCSADVTFSTPGERVLTATGTNSDGTSASADVTIEVVEPDEPTSKPTTPPAGNQPPIVEITSPDTGETFDDDDPLALVATAEDPDGDPMNVEWSTVRASDCPPQGCVEGGFGPEPVVLGTDTDIAWRPSETHDVSEGESLNVLLTFTALDSESNEASDSVRITIENPFEVD